MIKLQKTIIEAHLSSLKTAHNELIRLKDDAEQEITSLRRQIESVSIESVALQTCNWELGRTREDTEQEIAGLRHQMESLKHCALNELQEIISTHNRKEVLMKMHVQTEIEVQRRMVQTEALKHIVTMQTEFGVLAKELEACHQLPLVAVIERLQSQILELSLALRQADLIQGRHKLPLVETRAMQTEPLPKSDKSVQLHCTRTGQTQTESLPRSDKSVQLHCTCTGQTQAESPPTPTQMEMQTEILSPSVAPMTPTRLVSISASTTPMTPTCRPGVSTLTSTPPPPFTFRMTDSPGRAVTHAGQWSSTTRRTSIDSAVQTFEARIRKRERSASYSPL
ncbi:hypothetical protein BDN71DRAFT_1514378 [Pleurotus eryngii]|uniref:Uncharacterized protein n=1 Tax=Pleurotus eryngii TaxID=5323 RepID=A0A9P6D8V1_PLEER|nr:hypothetical protein BDN71DRAFT_1514378 [Pleurotus eryngii]